MLLRLAEDEKPDAAVLIDSPGFNLRLAKKLHSLGVPVLYYISPQVWAWRQGRVRGIAECVDKMMVLFGFEVDFYKDHGVDVVHVGHPLIDSVPTLEEIHGDRETTATIEGRGPRKRIRLGLMPGSRPSEVEALLPDFLDAGRLLAAKLQTAARGTDPVLEIVLVQAPTLDDDFVDGFVEPYRDDGSFDLRVVKRDRFREIRGFDLVLCASGTATLEVGLLGVPMIVAYRVAPLTYTLARRLVKIDHIALANLVLDDRVVPEMIQHDARAESLSAEAARLLGNPDELAAMRERPPGDSASPWRGGRKPPRGG